MTERYHYWFRLLGCATLISAILLAFLVQKAKPYPYISVLAPYPGVPATEDREN